MQAAMTTGKKNAGSLPSGPSNAEVVSGLQSIDAEVSANDS